MYSRVAAFWTWGTISDFFPFKPISRRTSRGRGASSRGQPGASNGARSFGKLNFRSAASAALSTETFSRRRVAPKDSARSLSGFDSPKRRNLSLAISVCTSRLLSRGSHPVATSRAANRGAFQSPRHQPHGPILESVKLSETCLTRKVEDWVRVLQG